MTETKKRVLTIATIFTAIVLICGIGLWIFLANIPWGFARNVSQTEQEQRLAFVAAAEQWLGCNGADNSHRQIIDLYNNHTPLAQGYIVQYDDSWCATFVSAAAINCGITDILPTECGCERQIRLFQEMGCWEENDSYVPLPGDVIYYSSSADISDDCTAWSDHVGIVVGTFGSIIKVIEGNYLNSVAYRYIRVDHMTIRGYGLPAFGQ